ncbi:MAG: N-acetylmuramoyl-L-alanine amidase [Lachnospiraceae bacterium]|nr:N-acetylmuramoyl-L-alanine amidase [Lachnospiraceae bacterium]
MFPIGFIEQIAPLIQAYAPTYGIKVCSPIIAQAILESASGTSELARNAHNYFGLKYRAGRCPTACGIYHKIGSEQNRDGSYTSSAMQWMKFSSMENGVLGYFDFINIPNYSDLKGVTDPKTYLKNIKKDGYATSLQYVENLMNVISKYNLTTYDNKGSDLTMGHSNSPLIKYTKISPNRTSPRNHNIDTITIHCMAGNLSVESCGNLFAQPGRQASSNYGIGSDGRIALYVEEKDRSWCSSNPTNDHRAVTIEVANDGGAPDWHVSDRAMTSLIELVADICKRNHIKELKWRADKSLVGQVDKQNMTVHRWFANKSCPGDYLYKKHGDIAKQVNQKLSGADRTAVQSTSASSAPQKQSKPTYLYQNVDYSPVFDPAFYHDTHRDLQQAFGNNTAKLFQHFYTYGMKEGRIANAHFNVRNYQSYHADLRNAFGDNLPLYYRHYVLYGIKENRKCL